MRSFGRVKLSECSWSEHVRNSVMEMYTKVYLQDQTRLYTCMRWPQMVKLLEFGWCECVEVSMMEMYTRCICRTRQVCTVEWDDLIGWSCLSSAGASTWGALRWRCTPGVSAGQEKIVRRMRRFQGWSCLSSTNKLTNLQDHSYHRHHMPIHSAACCYQP